MSERESVIDFTVPYYDLVGITIMMKKPKVRENLDLSRSLQTCFEHDRTNKLFTNHNSLFTIRSIHYSLFTIQFWYNRLDMQVPTSLFKFLSVLEESVWGCILVCHQQSTYSCIFSNLVHAFTQFLLINDIYVLFTVISLCQT